MAPVAVLNEQDLFARRRAALARIHVSEDDLRARATVYSLDPTELAVLDELDDLDFLLGAADEE